LGLALGACPAKEAPPIDNQTLGRLAACEDSVKREKATTEGCQKQLEAAKTTSAAASGSDVVVRIDGNTLTVLHKPNGGPIEQAGGTSADDMKLYEAFVGQVRGSKSGIQVCYAQAAKKNVALQGRSVDLQVSVSLKATGRVANALFSPRISADFDGCMKKLTSSWKVPPYYGEGVRFDYTVTMQPAD
jgi:hypothetical protein